MAGVIDTQEALDVRGKSQLTPMDITTIVSEYNGFTASTIPTVGIYWMWSNVNCYFKHNTAASQTACTATNGIWLNLNNPISIRITKNDVISALADTTTGKLKFVLLRAEA